MQTMTTIGLDIAKSVFQVHGVDAGGQVIFRRQLKRRYVLTFFQKLSPCLVGIEACGSANGNITSKVTAICAACSWPAHFLSSATPRSMAQTSALAYGVAGQAADQGCGNRARQQDRADGLRHDGDGRAIQRISRACAINEIALGNWRDVKIGRANST
jgi:hypothetical protein